MLFASVGSRLRISLRDYGWVKQGMIYPFVDYIDRFQGQSLYIIRPTRFRGGIEEAFLAERGFFCLQMDVGCSLQDSVSDQSIPDGIQEGVASNNVLECQSKAQVAADKSARCCGSCGNHLPSKLSKKKSKGASSCFVGTLKRDIKCANILVHANGSVKLTDFGLAKEITKFNAVKSCKGTVYWMAPETYIINGQKGVHLRLMRRSTKFRPQEGASCCLTCGCCPHTTPNLLCSLARAK